MQSGPLMGPAAAHALIVGALAAPPRLLAPAMKRTTGLIDREAAR